MDLALKNRLCRNELRVNGRRFSKWRRLQFVTRVAGNSSEELWEEHDPHIWQGCTGLKSGLQRNNLGVTGCRFSEWKRLQFVTRVASDRVVGDDDK